MDFTNLVTGVGFQIACIAVMGAWIDRKDKQNREDTQKTLELFREDAKADKEMLLNELNYSREVNSKMMATTEIMAKEISTKLDRVLEKVEV
jgi:hypothetical protein